MPTNYEGFGYNESTDRAASFTLAVTDGGVVQNITATTGTVVVTLPTSAAGTSGVNFIVKNQGGATVQITPVAADGFSGNGFTATVNKYAQSITAGDTISIRGNGATGVTAWNVAEVSGTWSRQA